MVAATAQQITAPTTRISEKLKPRELATLFARTTMMAVYALMMFAALHPETRNFVRSTLTPNADQRKVISTAQAHLAGDTRLFTVAKVKAGNVLALEIFENYGNGQQNLVEKIQLADSRDGFFDFNGKSSNLALSDINGDGRPEILAPTFDNNLVGRLNIYGFDTETNAFQKMVR